MYKEKLKRTNFVLNLICFFVSKTIPKNGETALKWLLCTIVMVENTYL